MELIAGLSLVPTVLGFPAARVSLWVGGVIGAAMCYAVGARLGTASDRRHELARIDRDVGETERERDDARTEQT